MKMNIRRLITLFAGMVVGLSFSAAAAPAFVGGLTATLTRGGQTQTFVYTVGTNTLRIERGETDRPYAWNLVDRKTGRLTLLFPHNRSFLCLKTSGVNCAAPAPAMPGMPHAGLPPGIGPQTAPTSGLPIMPAPPAGTPAGIERINLSENPRIGSMPPMFMMPPPGRDKLELKATGDRTNLLGYACARYEIKQRAGVMEIWATDQLLPYQSWQPNQPPRWAPQRIVEQWGELVQAKGLFPLLATLRFENGPEQLRFEVKSIMPQKTQVPDGAWFQPPADYQEIRPLPF